MWNVDVGCYVSFCVWVIVLVSSVLNFFGVIFVWSMLLIVIDGDCVYSLR